MHDAEVHNASHHQNIILCIVLQVTVIAEAVTSELAFSQKCCKSPSDICGVT